MKKIVDRRGKGKYIYILLPCLQVSYSPGGTTTRSSGTSSKTELVDSTVSSYHEVIPNKPSLNLFQIILATEAIPIPHALIHAKQLSFLPRLAQARGEMHKKMH